MHITLSPVRRDDRPVISRQGDTLIIDGAEFDFSGVTEGATLPAEAIASDWFCGPVERIGGVLHLTAMLSHGANAPQETLFPEPVHVTEDGPIPLPPYEIIEEPEAAE